MKYLSENRPVDGVERVAAVLITLSLAVILYVMLPLLVEIMLYLMGAVAIYALWRGYVWPELQVRKFRREVQRGTRHPH